MNTASRFFWIGVGMLVSAALILAVALAINGGGQAEPPAERQESVPRTIDNALDEIFGPE